MADMSSTFSTPVIPLSKIVRLSFKAKVEKWLKEAERAKAVLQYAEGQLRKYVVSLSSDEKTDSASALFDATKKEAELKVTLDLIDEVVMGKDVDKVGPDILSRIRSDLDSIGDEALSLVSESITALKEAWLKRARVFEQAIVRMILSSAFAGAQVGQVGETRKINEGLLEKQQEAILSLQALSDAAVHFESDLKEARGEGIDVQTIRQEAIRVQQAFIQSLNTAFNDIKKLLPQQEVGLIKLVDDAIFLVPHFDGTREEESDQARPNDISQADETRLIAISQEAKTLASNFQRLDTLIAKAKIGVLQRRIETELNTLEIGLEKVLGVEAKLGLEDPLQPRRTFEYFIEEKESQVLSCQERVRTPSLSDVSSTDNSESSEDNRVNAHALMISRVRSLASNPKCSIEILNELLTQVNALTVAQNRWLKKEPFMTARAELKVAKNESVQIMEALRENNIALSSRLRKAIKHSESANSEYLRENAKPLSLSDRTKLVQWRIVAYREVTRAAGVVKRKAEEKRQRTLQPHQASKGLFARLFSWLRSLFFKEKNSAQVAPLIIQSAVTIVESTSACVARRLSIAFVEARRSLSTAVDKRRGIALDLVKKHFPIGKKREGLRENAPEAQPVDKMTALGKWLRTKSPWANQSGSEGGDTSPRRSSISCS